MRFHAPSSAIGFVLAAHIALGHTAPCDPNLIPPSANPYGYRLRGERCEGVYVQQVRDPSLVIASWTESFAAYDPSSPEPLVIEWGNAGSPGTVRLRAQGLRRRLYYRMDALPGPGATSFRWPPDVLRGLQIPKKDLGLVAMTRTSIAGTERDLYLPVRLRQVAEAPASGEYGLTLVPGVELKEVYVSLFAVSPETGSVVAALKRDEPVGYGYYPAERPIQIPIKEPHAGGIYHLELGATFQSGGSATSELWFYHRTRKERRK